MWKGESSVDSIFTLIDVENSSFSEISFQGVTQNGLSPFAYHSDYDLLVFRCVQRKDGFFQVIVNESTRSTKLLPDSLAMFKFYTWEQHILSDVAFITFNHADNPVRSGPYESSARFDSQSVTFGDHFYQPMAIRGKWLQVRWEGEGKSWNEGWVKWKDNDIIIVDLYYFA